MARVDCIEVKNSKEDAMRYGRGRHADVVCNFRPYSASAATVTRPMTSAAKLLADVL